MSTEKNAAARVTPGMSDRKTASSPFLGSMFLSSRTIEPNRNSGLEVNSE